MADSAACNTENNAITKVNTAWQGRKAATTHQASRNKFWCVLDELGIQEIHCAHAMHNKHPGQNVCIRARELAFTLASSPTASTEM
jgi:hypothetical protein